MGYNDLKEMGFDPENDFYDQMEPSPNDTAIGCLAAIIFCAIFWTGVITVVSIIFK